MTDLLSKFDPIIADQPGELAAVTGQGDQRQSEHGFAAAGGADEDDQAELGNGQLSHG